MLTKNVKATIFNHNIKIYAHLKCSIKSFLFELFFQSIEGERRRPARRAPRAVPAHGRQAREYRLNG